MVHAVGEEDVVQQAQPRVLGALVELVGPVCAAHVPLCGDRMQGAKMGKLRGGPPSLLAIVCSPPPLCPGRCGPVPNHLTLWSEGSFTLATSSGTMVTNQPQTGKLRPRGKVTCQDLTVSRRQGGA